MGPGEWRWSGFPAAHTFHRHIRLRLAALLHQSLGSVFHQPGQDQLQIAPDAEQLAGVLGGRVEVDLLEIVQHLPVPLRGNPGDLKVFAEKIAAVQLHGGGKADRDERKLVLQSVALQLCDQNFHILHISPLGYVTPAGTERSLALPDGNWTVLPNTALGIPGGYADWLGDCLLAIRWALRQPGVEPDRLSLFGTSQGGGGSLLLASILGRSRVRCVCADLPFLTDFPHTGLQGEAYGLLRPVREQLEPEVFWQRLGFVDTLNHAHRLAMPVMLSAGGADDTCPPSTVEALFDLLPGTKQYTYLEHQEHTHSRSSMVLFGAWLHLYG